MPFIGTQRVKDLEQRVLLPEKIGDLCALAYKPMVEKWLANPSWTTWSRIRLEGYNGTWKRTHLDSRKETWDRLFSDDEAQGQVEAALEVLFVAYIKQYEIDRFIENGGVINKEH